MNKTTQDLINAYKSVFDTPSGEKVLKNLIKSAGMLNVNPIKRETDFMFWEGKKAMVLEILRILKMKDDDVIGVIKNSEE